MKRTPKTPRAVFPRVVTMSCLYTTPGSAFDWHTHPFDELCLVDGGDTTIGHGGVPRPASSGTLFLFRAGERHGYWNTRSQHPRLWVIHYQVRPDTYAALGPDLRGGPDARVWTLERSQMREYVAAFQRINTEHASSAPGSRLAEAARIELLLVSVQRLRAPRPRPAAVGAPGRATAEPALMTLWHLVTESHEPLSQLTRRFATDIPNYDSLRHRFVRTFGCSPRDLAIRVRISRAKSLLLDSALSVKEVAAAVGYGRQHEFSRAFHRATGLTPSAFRAQPLAPFR